MAMDQATSATLRQRTKHIKQASQSTHGIESDYEANGKRMSVSCWLSLIAGSVLLALVSYKYSEYVSTLHENDLWFTNIKEVEREISFRTESGLYYSYYKQLVQAKSFSQGIQELVKDNRTEYPSEVNILQRMNIYQEVFLAFCYRNFPFIKSGYEPIFFYISSVFFLHGLLIGSVYCLAWQLSGSWLAGLLSAFFCILNLDDTTRVHFTIPLRESFALPFLWMQICVLTAYLKHNMSQKSQVLCLIGFSITTFCFTLAWQFSQFVLLLQAATILGLHFLGFIPKPKASSILSVHCLCVLCVWWLQYYQPMILTCPVLSFSFAALLIINSNIPFSSDHVSRMFAQTAAVSVAALFINVVLKVGECCTENLSSVSYLQTISQHEADEHIFKFLQAKFGLSDPIGDLDVQLYLCNKAFAFLPSDVFGRLSKTFLLPLYLIAQTALIAEISYVTYTHRRHPERLYSSYRADLAYNLSQPISFALMALMVLRMKYLWTPYMAVIASVGLSYLPLYQHLSRFFQVSSNVVIQLGRHIAILIVLSLLCFKCLPNTLKELKNLREFHDPDTVELMEWIKSDTAEEACFTGTMQLMAGVKLCTNRPIANHPHFEDKSLRVKTSQLYQMYGRFPPPTVHAILNHYKVSYMVLEDSQCMAPNRGDGCRLTDLVDVSFGMMPEGGSRRWPANLAISAVPRFCDAIRRSTPDFLKYFRLVFSNRTFRVYKLLSS